MKVYIKQVDTTVYFKQYNADFEIDGTEEFTYNNIGVEVGDVATRLGESHIQISDNNYDECQSWCIDFNNEKEAKEYAEKLREICAMVVTKYRKESTKPEKEESIFEF